MSLHPVALAVTVRYDSPMPHEHAIPASGKESKVSTIKVELSDYLSDSDMRSIAVEAFRAEAATKAREDFQRILDNAAYELVRREVDAVFDGGMAETVKAKATKVIAELSAFTVFKKPDAWCREASVAWTHLQAAMRDAQPAIEARVHEVIASMDRDALSDLIADQVGAAILGKLTASAEAN